MTSTLTEKAVIGRRVTFTYFRDMPDGPSHPGIVTGTKPGLSGGLLALIRLDGHRSNLSIPVGYEGLTYLDEVVPVPELPMGRFTPTAGDASAIREKEGVLFAAIGEDGEDLVLITDDRDKAWKAAAAYLRGAGIDPDYVDAGDLKAKWAVFEWQPEDAECPWLVHWPVEESDDQAVHIYYLPVE